MKFLVQSGSLSLPVEAVDFNQAAIHFMKSLTSDQETELGDVISVTCEVTESWMQTTAVAKSAREPRELRIA